MKQEQRITYNAGITRSPSDFLCNDGDLSDCVNLTSENEEIKPIVPPKPTTISIPSSATLLYVHRIGTRKNYVYTSQDDVYVLYKNNSNVDATQTLIRAQYDGLGTIVSVSAIGKTLIILGSTGVSYALWQAKNSNPYKVLGEIPEPDVRFWLTIPSDGEIISTGKKDVGSALDFDSQTGVVVKEQDAYNDLIIGMYAELKKKVKHTKAFCNPFFACVALKMYDGSYTKVTAPVLLFPSVTRNAYCYLNAANFIYTTGRKIEMRMVLSFLWLSQLTNYADYSDLVKDVVLFVSNEIDINNNTWDCPFTTISEGNVLANGIWDGVYTQKTAIGSGNYNVLTRDDRIVENITSASVFYKLASLGLKAIGSGDASRRFGETTLETLTTQEQLPLDYYSHVPLWGDNMYVYNSRLNLFALHRGFFPGFKHFISYEKNRTESSYQYYDYEIYVTIKTETGDKVVKQTISNSSEKLWIWFYYPDPRAYNAKVFNGNTCVANMTLTEHPGMNGAYYFKGMPTGTDTAPTVSGVSKPTVSSGAEYLPNNSATSEVNNPFVFKAEGYNVIGNGAILGAATQTQALSQGQFGQYPLILFTSEGLWAMEISATGLYSSMKPLSRDVCTNPKCIIETDNAVFFPSKKGLMMIAGSTVVCVSEKINGKADTSGTYAAYLALDSEDTEENAFMDLVHTSMNDQGLSNFLESSGVAAAYDYRNSRLIFLSNSAKYAFVYNIKTQFFSKLYMQGYTYRYSVRDYPDYLLGRIGTGQNATHTVCSLLDIGDENLLDGLVRGVLITRPIKFSGPVNVDSVREMKHVGMWNTFVTPEENRSFVKCVLLMSDDLYHWYKADSRFGAAAKYWRWILYVKMKPSERLSGTIVRTQPRRTDNIR